MDTPEQPESSPSPTPSGAAAASGLQPGQVIGGGRFELKAILGQGGMGQVWLARDLRLGEDNALKVLPPEIRNDPVALDDMRRETLKSRKLTHPNIVRIYDLHETPGEPAFIAMEYVEGQNLGTLRLKQENRFFTWEFLAPLIKQLCEALDYAHGERVIHRDLKPANMMIDGRGRLKLADFGIAATLSDSASRVSVRHATSGTVTHMSPQQMDGELPRVTDDIYALGASLYELLASRPPFFTGDIPHQVRNLPAKPIDERLAELELKNDFPPAVAALVMACLSKDPASRPQSARAVADWIGFAAPQPSGASLLDTVSDGAPPAEPPPAQTAGEPEPAAASKAWIWAAIAAGVVVIAGAVSWLVHARKPGGPAAAAVGKAPVHEPGSTAIFNGKDFTGWVVPEPNPLWSIEGSVIIGKQPKQSKRGFHLATKNNYEDFELELEARYNAETDATIIFRKDQKSQVRVGYFRNQATDTTGSFFETGNPAPVAAAKNVAQAAHPGTWNKLRIRAQGHHFSAWVNGQEVMKYDSPSYEGPGPITLVLNGKGESQVEFRNFRLKDLTGVALTGSAPPGGPTFVLDPAFNPGAGSDELVYAVGMQPDGKSVVAAGRFTSFAGIPCNFAVRLNSGGALDRTFVVGPAIDKEIRALAVQKDGKVLLGGAFGAREAVVQHFARLETDGTVDRHFAAQVAGAVHSVALLADGQILIGGSFNSVSGVECHNVARLKPDGNLAPDFNGDLAINREVRGVSVMADGRLLIAGSFTTVTRAVRNHVAILGRDGVLDRKFLPGTILNAMAWSTAAQADGRVLVAGRFTKAGSMKCSYIVRFNPDGKVDTSFNPGSGPDGELEFVTVTPQGKIIIAGNFTHFDGVPCGHLAQLNSDGNLEYGFADSGADGSVHSVAVMADGGLLIGGGFSNAGGQPRKGVARLKLVPAASAKK